MLDKDFLSDSYMEELKVLSATVFPEKDLNKDGRLSYSEISSDLTTSLETILGDVNDIQTIEMSEEEILSSLKIKSEVGNFGKARGNHFAVQSSFYTVKQMQEDQEKLKLISLEPIPDEEGSSFK